MTFEEQQAWLLKTGTVLFLIGGVWAVVGMITLNSNDIESLLLITLFVLPFEVGCLSYFFIWGRRKQREFLFSLFSESEISEQLKKLESGFCARLTPRFLRPFGLTWVRFYLHIDKEGRDLDLSTRQEPVSPVTTA